MKKNAENQVLFNKIGLVVFTANAIYTLVQFVHQSISAVHLAGSLVPVVLLGIRYIWFSADMEGQTNKLALLKVIDVLTIVGILSIYSYKSILALLYILMIVGNSTSYGVKVGKVMLYIAILAYTIRFFGEMMIPRNLMPEGDLYYFMLFVAFIYVFSTFFIKMMSTRDEYAAELRKSNEQLNLKVAEFYTLHHIQNSISSIRDTKKLFEEVNDIIIGVIGPTYSSIVLKKDFDSIESASDSFTLSATNMEEQYRDDFIEKDCPMLWNRIESEKGFLCETHSCDIELSDSRIKGLIAVPFVIKKQKVGMIVVSHFVDSALNDEFLRLLGIISGSISIGLENTWLYEKLQDMATTDGLTMVYNRMYFQQAVEEELIKTLNRHPMSIVICDIDYFKNVNDNYGHMFGDTALKAVVSIIQSSIRSADTLARYGGEEFVIIFPRTDLEQSYAIVERLRQKIEHTVIEDKQHAVSITVSFGIASYPEHGDSVRKILKEADDALYQAKRDGRNCTRKAPLKIGT